MPNNKHQRRPSYTDAKLAMMMKAVVDARGAMAYSRSRLRTLQAELSIAAGSELERLRDQARREYVQRNHDVRQARTQLLRRLQERFA